MEHKRIKWLVLLGIVIVAGLVLLVLPPYQGKAPSSARDLLSTATTTESPTASGTPEGWSTYTDTMYGFAISYPQGVAPQTTFKTFYHLSNGWRADAPADSTGTPVVAFPIFSTESSSSYPRYFDTEVRVGVSENPADVANCTAPGRYATASSTQAVINGVSFSKFPIENAGMMQYLKGESFRTVHAGRCYAIEQLATGSSYRDATSSRDISDATLQNYYDKGRDIVNTFIFTDASGKVSDQSPAVPPASVQEATSSVAWLQYVYQSVVLKASISFQYPDFTGVSNSTSTTGLPLLVASNKFPSLIVATVEFSPVTYDNFDPTGYTVFGKTGGGATIYALRKTDANGTSEKFLIPIAKEKKVIEVQYTSSDAALTSAHAEGDASQFEAVLPTLVKSIR